MRSGTPKTRGKRKGREAIDFYIRSKLGRGFQSRLAVDISGHIEVIELRLVSS